MRGLVDIGTTGGTVAAGNDSRIINAVQRGNNLSDLVNKAVARSNLGLGTAATAHIQTSVTDSTAGALMRVGAFGTGGAEINIADGTDIYKYFPTARTGNYGGGVLLTNALATGWRSFKWQQHGYDQKYGVLIEVGSNGQMAVHIYHNPNGDMKNPEKYWINTGLIYGERWKPGPSDVDAVSASNGGTFQKGISVKGAVTIGSGKGFAISDVGNSASYMMLRLWGNAARPTILEANDSTSYHWYSQRNTDGSVVFNVNGRIIPNDFSNFDSRYVQGIRVSATATRNFTPGGGWSPHDSAFVTAISMVGGMSNTGTLLVRYIQRNINGVWANVVA